MIKSAHPGRMILAGLIVIFGCTILFNISAANNSEIKTEKIPITIKEREIGRIEHWSLPKRPDNIPWFYQSLSKIVDFGQYVVNFQDTDKLPFGKSVAFLVGVSTYKYVKPQNLSFVENDLKELAHTLLTDCGFDDVYIAKNEAVSPELIKAVLLNKFCSELNNNDRLLFYYSGHGADLGGNTGYMQFSGCNTDKRKIDYNTDVLRIDECKEWSNLIQIKHILFLFDCCVSGWGFIPKGKPDKSQPTCLSMSKNGSRAVITAGTGKEPSFGGADHSIFTEALIDTLKRTDLYQQNNGFLTIDEIFTQTERKIASQSDVKQSPRIWELDSSYQGKFIFINTDTRIEQLSANDLHTLHIKKKVVPRRVLIGEYGIIRLNSYLSGKVFIDDVEVGSIHSGEAYEYIDQPIGRHIIKITNGDSIAIRTVEVSKGEASFVSISPIITKVIPSESRKNTIKPTISKLQSLEPTTLTPKITKELLPASKINLNNNDFRKANGSEVSIRLGHSAAVGSVTISPDGKYILTGSWDQTLKLWEINTGRQIRNFIGHSDSIMSVAISPDGRYALSGSYDNSLKLWNIKTGKQIRSFIGHSKPVLSVAISPDGIYALSGSSDQTLKLWEVSTGKEIRTFYGHLGYVMSVAFSPDGYYALSGSFDKTLKLWEIRNGKETRDFIGHLNGVMSVAFSPDGKYALSGSWDKTLILWEISTGKEIKRFKGHSGGVNSVVFTPDGKYALSGSIDNTLKLWEIDRGMEIKSYIGHSNSVDSIVFSLDGKYAISGSRDTSTRIWEIASGKEIARFVGFDDGEWIVLTPEGYYNVSPKGSKYLKVSNWR
ncbi:MAG TPA: caspase family protein [Bacillota bacterium]|nr:caspase family protein [Bacillota bacterium]